MARPDLAPIPVIATGPAFALATFEADPARVQALMDVATRYVPRLALTGLDLLSRAWLERHANPYLPEIEAIATRLGRPGGYYLAVNYEWGCTVGVGPSPDGRSARLARTLDWGTQGLGIGVIAAKVAAPAGPFIALTWPGFTGVMQAMAPGRFSAAINQAPMRRLGGGVLALDWAANRIRVWRQPHGLAAHLLRRVFEEAADFAAAQTMLRDVPIAAPATFTLAGIAPGETCVIERSETEAHVTDGASAATNHWCGLDHGARPRGLDSQGRRAAILDAAPYSFEDGFSWLAPPILNDTTQLVMIADAAHGRLMAQGYGDLAPATALLDITISKSDSEAGRRGEVNV